MQPFPSSTGHPDALKALQEAIDALAPEQIIAPTETMPATAHRLGVATPRLQRIYTISVMLSLQTDPLVQRVEELTEYLMSATGAIPAAELATHRVALEQAQAELSPYEAMHDLAWALLCAEVLQIYPSAKYLKAPLEMYAGWEIAFGSEVEEEDDLSDGVTTAGELLASVAPNPGQISTFDDDLLARITHRVPGRA